MPVRVLFHELGDLASSKLDKHKLGWRDRYRLVYRLFELDAEKNLYLPDMGFLLLEEGLKKKKKKKKL